MTLFVKETKGVCVLSNEAIFWMNLIPDLNTETM